MNRDKLRKIKKRSRNKVMVLNHEFWFNNLFHDDISTSKAFYSFFSDNHFKNMLDNVFLPKKIEMYNKKIYFDNNVNKSSLKGYCLNLIKKYHFEINKFLKYKTQYETYLFKEDYQNALGIIKKIEKEICISVWSMQQNIILIHQIGGIEENKKEVERLNEQLNNNLILNLVLEFYSYLAEENMSINNYEHKLQSLFENIKASSHSSALRTYFEMKLSFDVDKLMDIENFNFIFQFETQFSVIDIYLTYIEFFQCYSYKNNFTEIETYLLPLKGYIDDYIFDNILIKFSKTEVRAIDNEYKTIMEKYTAGEYGYVIEKVENSIKRGCIDFQFYLILVKAKIELNQAYISDIKIVNNLMNILSFSEKFEQSLRNLRKYLKMYHGTSWKYKLLHFIRRKTTPFENEFLQNASFLNDYIVSPNFSIIIDDSSNKEIFLNEMEESFYYTTQMMKFKFNLLPSESLNNVKADEFKKILFIARRFSAANEHSEVIKLLDQVYFDDLNLYKTEKIYKDLIKSYYCNNQIHECLKIIINAYYLNKNIIKRVDIDNITKELKRNKVVKKDILYPILININDESDLDSLRISFSNFLDSNNITNVSQLIDFETEELEYKVHFLRKIATLYIIKRDVTLSDNSDDAESIRLSILNYLIEFDNKNKKIYFEEINQIITSREIQNRIKQVNSSRVFIGIENIKERNQEFWKEEFRRYAASRKFGSNVVSLDIDKINEVINQTNTSKTLKPAHDKLILNQIIKDITDKYLFDETQGLATFLSSRIRHGFVNNTLSSVFYEHHLMSKSAISGSDEYRINEYLQNFNSDEIEDLEDFIQLFSDFSRRINNSINQVKNEWIKIKLINSDEGVLDFINSVEYMTDIYYFEERMDFDILFNFVLDVLRKRTHLVLENLRYKLTHDLKQSFIMNLNDLESKLIAMEKVHSTKIVAHFKKNINLCKVKIDSVVKNLSDVFQLKDIIFHDFTARDLIKTCLGISSRLIKDFDKINIQQNIKVETEYRGEIFIFLVDILNNLINNAIEHSKFDDLSKLNIDITMFNDSDNILNFIIENNLNFGVDIEKTKFKIEEILGKVVSPEEHTNLSQSEGGTGIYKTLNTIIYNLDQNYFFDYVVEEGKFLIKFKLNIENPVLT